MTVDGQAFDVHLVALVGQVEHLAERHLGVLAPAALILPVQHLDAGALVGAQEQGVADMGDGRDVVRDGLLRPRLVELQPQLSTRLSGG